jgi:glycogen operon protein
MLLGGDEFGRTQGGNNNAWCQDNEISWVDWSLPEANADLHAFTKRLIALRAAEPVFHRARFLRGDSEGDIGLPDAWWFRPDGRRMTRRNWERADTSVLGLFLNGQDTGNRDSRGEPITGDSFVLLFNAGHEDVTFRLPARRLGARWALELRTDDPDAAAGSRRFAALEQIPVVSRSVIVLRRDETAS